MIFLFHGDDLEKSRRAFNQIIDHFSGETLRIDYHQINLDKINNFLEGASLLSESKMLALSNFFSLSPASQKKIAQIFNQTNTDIAIWQDKKLNPAALKIFPKAKINYFPLPNTLYACLNQIRPHNFKNFAAAYQAALKSVPFDLLFFMIKKTLRQNKYKDAYLQLIELDYQNKTGQLTINKEIALLQIMMTVLT
ncbi:MAG TPA: hypothetical protein PK131_03275 [Candidatus Woesebacteria bacterium]|nr:hypothetical protein [Candidatus Woesebacteria bacterium]HRS23048.1 hypothetical protein [Candidatus Woesebacteria bacterium]HRT40385.1 hypothetical protein [Candidatus Woesebacteria bacterium]